MTSYVDGVLTTCHFHLALSVFLITSLTRLDSTTFVCLHSTLVNQLSLFAFNFSLKSHLLFLLWLFSYGWYSPVTLHTGMLWFWVSFSEGASYSPRKGDLYFPNCWYWISWYRVYKGISFNSHWPLLPPVIHYAGFCVVCYCHTLSFNGVSADSGNAVCCNSRWWSMNIYLFEYTLKWKACNWW